MEVWIVVKWLFAFAALTAIGAPIAAAMFQRLPKKGGALALPSALVPFTLVIFWVGQVSFGTHTVALGALVVVAIGTVALHQGYIPEWRAVAGAYGVFAAGFLFVSLLRASTPGITPAGGEQFLHFGLVNALMRAEALPPEDFWFAGEPLRYYYGTQLQVTSFTMLTDTAPRYGYNLGIAAFYGLLVVTAYGLVGAVVTATGRSYHLGGALGAFFVAVAGSLTTGVRLSFGLLPRDVALAYGQAAFGAVRHLSYEEAVTELRTIEGWEWFYTRYVVPDTLQEFPLYSFVKADLHGHAMANGYVLFAAALAFAYYRTPADEQWRRRGLLFGGIGAVAGVFGFMNTWSLPTAVGLAWLAMAGATAHPATLLPASLADRLSFPAAETGDRGLPARIAAEGWRVVLAGALATVVAAVGIALASPFLVFGHVPTNDGIGLFPPRTPLTPFLVLYGGVFALFAAFLAARGWRPFQRESLSTVVATIISFGILLAVAVATSFPVLAVTAPLLATAWWLVRTDRVGFEAVLLVAGVGLLLSMDLVYAKVWPPTQIRWNTTLKVAVQGWTLAGAAAGAMGALLLADARDVLADRVAHARVDTGSELLAIRRAFTNWAAISAVLAGMLVVAVLAASAPFAVLVTSKKVADDVGEPEQLTLDGLDVHDSWKGEEMQAIYWLDEREGSPTIAEAPGRDTYEWANPASTMTGLPAVVGWSHEQKHRGTAAFERRTTHVDAVYTGSWTDAAAVLRYYDVSYVYVGPHEREVYGDDLRSFDREALSVAYENDAVTIYAVDQSALPEAASSGDGE